MSLSSLSLWQLPLSLLAPPAPSPGSAQQSGQKSLFRGGAESGNGEKESADTSQPPQPPALPLNCFWQPQISDERLMGQIFMEVTSSTWASPKQPRQLLAPYPMANMGHLSLSFAPGGRAHHRHGNVPMSHQLQAGPLALIL